MVTEQALLAALRVLSSESIGDFVYEIRDRVLGDPEWPSERTTWEHPRVVAYGEACAVVERYVAEHPELTI